MAGLTRLPMELILVISKDFDPDDLLALRMVSKKSNAIFQDLHLRSLYQNRVLYLVPASFENLLRISTHPSGVNKLVRGVQIRYPHPYFKPEHSEYLGELLKNWVKHPRNKRKYISLFKHLVQASRDVLSELENNPISNSTNLEVLSTTFANFPNLNTVEFGTEWSRTQPGLRLIRFTGGCPEERQYVNLFYPRLGLRPGTRVLPWIRSALDANKRHTFNSKMADVVLAQVPIPTLLDAIVSGNARIKEFLGSKDIPARVVRDRYFNMIGSRLEEHGRSLGLLNTLSLYLEFGPAKWETPARNPFFVWLNTVGGNLKILDLSGPSRFGWRPRDHYYNLVTPPVLKLPRLQNLKLKWLYLDATPLIATFESVQQTLECFELQDCVFEDAEKDIFVILQTLSKSSALKRFYFNTNYEEDRRAREDMVQYQTPDRLTLPGLEVNGYWSSPDTRCKVSYFGTHDTFVEKCKSGETDLVLDDWVINSVHLPDALQRFAVNETSLFWDFISHGHWLNDLEPFGRYVSLLRAVGEWPVEMDAPNAHTRRAYPVEETRTDVVDNVENVDTSSPSNIEEAIINLEEIALEAETEDISDDDDTDGKNSIVLSDAIGDQYDDMVRSLHDFEAEMGLVRHQTKVNFAQGLYNLDRNDPGFSSYGSIYGFC